MTMLTLLTPMKYLLIRHRTKGLYDAVLPLCGGLLLTWALVSWTSVPTFGKDGYLNQIQGLLTILGGFFIAALTLITADRNPLLLQPVGGLYPPRLLGEAAPLNRRRFLGYLFGYLAFSSFMLAGSGLMANLFADGLKQQISVGAHIVAKGAFLFVFNAWLTHVFVSTLLGLFYFTERLQQSDRKVRLATRENKAKAAELVD